MCFKNVVCVLHVFSNRQSSPTCLTANFCWTEATRKRYPARETWICSSELCSAFCSWRFVTPSRFIGGMLRSPTAINRTSCAAWKINLRFSSHSAAVGRMNGAVTYLLLLVVVASVVVPEVEPERFCEGLLIYIFREHIMNCSLLFRIGFEQKIDFWMYSTVYECILVHYIHMYVHTQSHLSCLNSYTKFDFT